MFSNENSRYQFILVPKYITNNDVFKKTGMTAEQNKNPLGTRRNCLEKNSLLS